MINFFAIVLIIFIGILIQVFKKRSFKKLINKSNLYSIKLNKNNKFSSKKIVFYTITKKKSTQYFIKILKEIKCLFFFRVIQKIN